MHRLKSCCTPMPFLSSKGFQIELIGKGSFSLLIWEPEKDKSTLETRSLARAQHFIEVDIAEKQALLDARYKQLLILKLVRGVA